MPGEKDSTVARDVYLSPTDVRDLKAAARRNRWPLPAIEERPDGSAVLHYRLIERRDQMITGEGV